jgi:hypothetical protein
MPRRASVKVKQVGPDSWRVSTAALKPRYRICWPTELEANTDAERIRRQLSGTGADASQLRAVDSALHRLATVEAPGRGSELEFVVEWFLAHYRPTGGKTVAWYATNYEDRKKLKLSAKSMVEIRGYLAAFCAEFGLLTPDLVRADAIEAYLANNTSRYYRDKVLRAFFFWLTGAVSKKSRIAKLENPPLDKNPFDFVERVEYRKVRPTEILTYDEVMRVLLEAKACGLDVLAWFVWGLFTGMRPQAEAEPFWTLEGHGWNQIHLDGGVICVTDDLEKTGARIRDIAIQPNLRAWLDWFKAHNVVPAYSRRKWRAVVEAAVPERNAQDLLRHCFLSFLLKIEKESEVCYQGATSSGIIKKHYRRHVPQDQVAKFWGITPATLGLV